MQFQFKLKGGKSVNLRLSLYFRNQLCRLTKMGLTSIDSYMIGMWSEDGKELIGGGLMDNLELRAAFIAAGMQAENFYNAVPVNVDPMSHEVFDIMENIEGGIASVQWGEALTAYLNTIQADVKDSEPVKKKEVSKSQSTGKTSRIRASAK